MGLRLGLLAGLSLVALAASAGVQSSMAQSPGPQASSPRSALPQPPVPPKAPAVRLAQAQLPPTSRTPVLTPAQASAAKSAAMAVAANVPHTLIEALAATYSNQPALQAERAKLRATDENVPDRARRLAADRVLAGTGGYGDGVIPRISAR